MSTYTKIKPLSQRQKEILTRMANGEEIIFASGGGYWIDLDKIGGALINTLLRHCCITESSDGAEKYRIYTLNETGAYCLRVGYLCMHNDVLTQLKA